MTCCLQLGAPPVSAAECTSVPTVSEPLGRVNAAGYESAGASRGASGTATHCTRPGRAGGGHRAAVARSCTRAESLSAQRLRMGATEVGRDPLTHSTCLELVENKSSRRSDGDASLGVVSRAGDAECDGRRRRLVRRRPRSARGHGGTRATGDSHTGSSPRDRVAPRVRWGEPGRSESRMRLGTTKAPRASAASDAWTVAISGVKLKKAPILETGRHGARSARLPHPVARSAGPYVPACWHVICGEPRGGRSPARACPTAAIARTQAIESREP